MRARLQKAHAQKKNAGSVTPWCRKRGSKHSSRGCGNITVAQPFAEVFRDMPDHGDDMAQVPSGYCQIKSPCLMSIGNVAY
jgi:hypothetical protein